MHYYFFTICNLDGVMIYAFTRSFFLDEMHTFLVPDATNFTNNKMSLNVKSQFTLRNHVSWQDGEIIYCINLLALGKTTIKLVLIHHLYFFGGICTRI